MAGETTLFELAQRPWFLEKENPYKIWIYPLTGEEGAERGASELASADEQKVGGGTLASKAVVGMLMDKELTFTITPSGGWAPFRQMTASRLSKYFQLGGSTTAGKALVARLKNKGQSLKKVGDALGSLGDTLSAILTAAGKVAGAPGSLGTDFFTEQIFQGGSNYLGIQGVEMIFVAKDGAEKDVHAPLARLSKMAAQKWGVSGSLWAPDKVAVRIGKYNKPILKLDRAVIHSLAVTYGSPRDPDGYSTWGKAVFTIESARVVTDRLIRQAFGMGR